MNNQASPFSAVLGGKNLQGLKRTSASSLVGILSVAAAVVFLALVGTAVLTSVWPPESKEKSMISEARMEAMIVGNAIEAYHKTYGQFPVSSNTLSYALSTGGIVTYAGGPDVAHPGVTGLVLANSEVIARLMEKNPQKTNFLGIYVAPARSHGLGGIDKHGNFDDPWGNPYRISMDLERGKVRVWSMGPDGKGNPPISGNIEVR